LKGKRVIKFDTVTFLANAGLGRTIIELKRKQTFLPGRYTRLGVLSAKGRAKVAVVSQTDKEAAITLLSTGEFVGEEPLAAIAGLYMATAIAVNTCTALKIGRNKIIRVMYDEPAFIKAAPTGSTPAESQAPYQAPHLRLRRGPIGCSRSILRLRRKAAAEQ
jgi:hypothetical protein